MLRGIEAAAPDVTASVPAVPPGCPNAVRDTMRVMIAMNRAVLKPIRKGKSECRSASD
jgi:hypothetical protein